MNERIKQITGQVLDEIVPYTWTTLGYDKIKEIQYRTVELIVRECAAVIDADCEFQYSQGVIRNLGGLNQARALIKQHFGVQE